MDLPAIEPASLETELPAYLISQAGIFLSIKNTRWASFNLGIKSIELVDFNGDTEHIVTYKQSLKLDLGTVSIPRLLVYSNEVFASEYERIRITFDLDEATASWRDQQKDAELPIVNILNYGYVEKTFSAEVSLNKDSRFVLGADQPAFIHLSIDLDYSLKPLVDTNLQAWIFRPFIVAQTKEQPPEFFSLASYGIEFDPVSQLMRLQSTDVGSDLFKVGNVHATSMHAMNLFGLPNRINNLPHVMSGRSISFIEVTEEQWRLSFLGVHSAPLKWVLHQGELGSDFRSPDIEVSYLRHGVPISPSPRIFPEDLMLIPNQAAWYFFEENRASVWVMPVMTKVLVKFHTDSVPCEWQSHLTETFTLDALTMACEQLKPLIQHKYSDTGEQTFGVKFFTSDDNWHFFEQWIWPLDESAELRQSEFNGGSVIKAISFYHDWMLLTINPENLVKTSQTDGYIEQLRVNLGVQNLSISVYSDQGVSIKKFTELSDFHQALMAIQQSGGVVQDIFYDVDSVTGEIVSLSLTLYPTLSIDPTQDPYDSLLGLQQTMLEWISIYLKDDETLCQIEEGAGLRLASYCRHKRVVSGGKKLVSEFIHTHLFANKVGANTLRVQYFTMVSGLVPSERQVMNLYLQGDRGYFPKRMKNNSTIKKIEKVAGFLKKVYKLAGRLFPDATLQNAFDRVDHTIHKTPRVIIDGNQPVTKKPVRKSSK